MDTPPEKHPLAHTYQDDLNQAMDVTDPAAVQKMLNDARNEELATETAVTIKRERKWYGLSSFLLILLALALVTYGAYYYMSLTVKVQPAASVGVFQSSDNIVASTTSIQNVLAAMTASTTLPEGKPVLINLVSDNGALLTNSQLYTFIGAQVPEPLQSLISVARLGVVNTGKAIVPFIIASVPDPEKASNQFSIVEPSLLQLFYQALGISISGVDTNNLAFQSQYFNNLPTRTLSLVDPTTHQPQLAMLYGYASDNVIVITTKPEALKAVYDSIINQH